MAAAYLQDVWQPTNSLTLRPGLRLDSSSLLNNTGELVYESLTLSPRLGVAWDPSGNGLTNVHAYYGRFYDNGFLEISSLLSKESAGGGTYEWNSQLEEWDDEPSTSGDMMQQPPSSTPPRLGSIHQPVSPARQQKQQEQGQQSRVDSRWGG